MLINNTLDGYLKDIEIKGNTWQDSENLADIRSVGTKVEGQELYEIPVLSTGKNLFNINNAINGKVQGGTGILSSTNEWNVTDYIRNISSDVFISGISNSAVSGANIYIGLYDKNKTFIEFLSKPVNNCLIKSSEFKNCYYFVTSVNNKDLSTMQIEYNSIVTPYEPYKEDKLTILSPTPLEKVGDVADRIVCKDGVWGVEKNIKTIVLDGDEGGLSLNTNFNTVFGNENILAFKVILSDYLSNPKVNSVLSDKFKSNVDRQDDEEGIYCKDSYNGTNTIAIKLLKTKLSTHNAEGFRAWLKDNPTILKYQLEKPTFIPLPHSQQVKLRTFANRTHISFDTEMQPTLKAQVPKSLGATVNTHTSQIDSLNKELDRVKKLEESTVTTVTSDKTFTTVSETSNGYFEDVKVEGKTLVNLVHKALNYPTNGESTQTNKGFTLVKKSNGIDYFRFSLLKEIEQDKPYTIIYTITKNTLTNTQKDYGMYVDGTMGAFNSQTISGGSVDGKLGTYAVKIVDSNGGGIHSKNLSIGIHGGSVGGELNVDDIILLEGDHTGKDLSYFEGLKSVGQDTDEIEILSNNNGSLSNISIHDFNIDGKNVDHNLLEPIKNGESFKICYTNNSSKNTSLGIRFYYPSGTKYDGFGGVGSHSCIYTNNSGETLTKIATYRDNNCDGLVIENFSITKVKNIEDTAFIDYKPYKSNKKEILYYNSNTQTWEKPVLREWDSIEKRGDKYYYIKRSSEVVLNGSENWRVNAEATNVIEFVVGGVISNVSSNVNDTIFDKFKTSGRGDYDRAIVGTTNHIYITISKTKLSTQDVTGFKQWLQANPTTVVYQLAQEEVYECTNLDLITYQNETNLIINSGAIQPRLKLKVLSNVSNVVKLLQEKVSVLESDINKYMISQNRSQLDATYKSDSITFKIDYVNSSKNMTNDYSEDLYNLILDNILVGKDNYDYNHMFNLIMDYASWNKITWEQFDGLVLLMDLQHNPIEELPEELN